jgi:YHS domain-containing protein
MLFRRLSVVVVVIVCSTLVRAGDVAKYCNADKSGVAIKGYDPVSYFTSDKPAKGNEKITAQHEGVTYRFATDENRQKFLAEPKKYLPEYGGWCAKAMADKEKVDIDPTNYKITDGRLFLFYKGLLGDAIKPWNKDEKNLTQRADVNWKEITAQ